MYRLRKLSIVLFSMLFSLLLLEVGFRLFTPRPLSLLMVDAGNFGDLYYRFDPDIGMVHRPNVDLSFPFPGRDSGKIHFETNNHGLRRSTPTQLHRQEGLKRILVLGDSHVDGVVDNDENLTQFLEEKLTAGGDRWEVLNAAVGSYSPYQSLLWYRKFGREFEPDFIVLTIFLGNDIAELMSEGRPRLVREENGFREEGVAPTFRKEFLGDRDNGVGEALMVGVRNHSYLITHLHGFWSRFRRPATQNPVSIAQDYCPGCVAQSLQQLHWFAGSRDYREATVILEEVIRRFQIEAESQSSKLILALLPSRTQVEPDLDSARIEETAKILGLTREALGLEDVFYSELRSVAERLNLEVVDLVRAFKEAHSTSDEPIYYPLDWHLNERGHRLAADEIYRLLNANREDLD